MTWRVYLTEARRRRGHPDQEDFVRTLVLWARHARRAGWQREMPKICAILDLDPQTLKPVENVRKRA